MSTSNSLTPRPTYGIRNVERCHPELPVFRVPCGHGYGVYAPGHIVRVGERQSGPFFEMLEKNAPDDSPLGRTAGDVLSLAQGVQDAYRRRAHTPFTPVRLLVYVSNTCNARCIYCFSAKESGREDASTTMVSPDAARAAAEWIAPNCAAAGVPLQLIIHGGGEPSLHKERVERIVAESRAVAEAHGLPWRGFIATNGLWDASGMERFVALFDEFGLSCDGPPDIQERQRPARNGAASSTAVKKLTALLRPLGKPFSIRTTITRATCERQLEIALYLVGELGAQHLRFEPVYRAGADMGFGPDDAPWFLRHFVSAQQAALRMGATLDLSGVKLDALHGPYCDIGSETLHVLPDNSVTACFFAVDGNSGENQRVRIGAWDAQKNELQMDAGALTALQRKHVDLPGKCQGCLAQFHCSRDCPDVCYLRGQDERREEEGFRCRVNRLFTEHALIGLIGRIEAQEAPAAEPPPLPIDGKVLYDECRQHQEHLPAFDIANDLFRALRLYEFGDHEMPQPLWRRRGFDDSGVDARCALDHILGAPNEEPISVYVHIPFCETRCPFCDCHSTVASSKASTQMRQYTKLLVREIEMWGRLAGIRQRPVTTVHFGGGTPHHLPVECLDAILASLRQHLAVGPETEWAVETTGRYLDSGHLSQLTAWGFTRIHVGVQTLMDAVRRMLGRKESARLVVERIRAAVLSGAVVSVDLMYGLPEQHSSGICRDIEMLDEVGVHGFSLYHLNHTPQNTAFMQRHGLAERSRAQLLADYVSSQAGWRLLERMGYTPVFFNHFAKPEDHYLYYLSGARGEDLLGLGASADGRFGNYFYRNHELRGYLSEPIPVSGGGRPHGHEAIRERVAAQLMNAVLDDHVVDEHGLTALATQWREHGLLTPAPEEKHMRLTPTGAWFLGSMLDAVLPANSSGVVVS